MARLDDFLDPLEHGVFEVIVEKEEVTEPLDEGWEKSAVNLPSPGTVASYRKGQYHVHETKRQWKVHKDRYDPKDHPFLHLVDDAPLVFMIGGTFNALLFNTRETLRKDPRQLIEEYKAAWQLLLLAGIVVIIVGILIGLNPSSVWTGFLKYVVPLIILAFAVLLLWNGIRVKPLGRGALKKILLGLGVAAMGLIAFYSNLERLAVAVILVIAIWAFASAIVSIKRTAKGRLATPEGFYKRLGMGIFSLALAVSVLLAPRAMVTILIYVIALVALMIGVLLIVDGLGLRKAIKDIDIENLAGRMWKVEGPDEPSRDGKQDP